MNRNTSTKSFFRKTNSSIIDDYFKITSIDKQMKNLQFPNSVSDSENISKKSVYRPDKIRKRTKLEKYSTLKNSYSNKSTEVPSVVFFPGENEGKNDDNLLTKYQIALSSQNSIDKNDRIHDNIPNSCDNSPKLIIERKYSWEDVENWIPPSEKNRRRINQCKIKYSWEIIGVGSQTSETLIREFRTFTNDENYPCRIKYSWEVIGIGTQASLHDLSHLMSANDYWEGRIVIGSSGKNASARNNTPYSDESNKPRFVCNAGTQCTADKGVHTDLTDCSVKYSWQNLTKAYLRSDKLS